MPQSLPQKQFFHSLDGIRGVAALLVMLRHLPFLNLSGIPGTYLAVDLFFALSGVVICNAYDQRLRAGMPFVRFASMRLIRLYPLYLAGSALGMLYLLSQGGADPGVTPANIPLALAFLPDLRGGHVLYPFNHPGWSLIFEILVNLLYAALLRFMTVRVVIGVMLASAAGLFYLMLQDPGRHLDVGWTVDTLSGGLFRVGYSFFAGVLVYRLFLATDRGCWPVRHARAILPVAALTLAAALYWVAKSAVARPYTHLLVVLLVFPLATYVALWLEPAGWTARVMKVLGALSYPIYTLHVPAGLLFLEVYARLAGAAVPAGARWPGIVFLALFLPLCWVLHTYYDEPLRRRLLALGNAGRARAAGSPATK